MTANPQSPIPPIGPTTGMTPPPGQGRFKPIDPLRVLRQHLWLVVALAVAGVVAGVVTWGALRVLAPRYGSFATFELQNGGDLLDNDSDRLSRLSQTEIIEYLIKNEMVKIESERILRAVVNRDVVRTTQWFQQFEDDQGRSNLDRAIESLEKDHVSVAPIPDSTMFRIHVQTRHMDDAPRILDALVDVYNSYLADETDREISGGTRVLLNEQARLDQEVSQLQQNLSNFRQRHDIETLRADQSSAGIEHAELSTRKIMLQAGLAAAQESLQALQEAHETGEVQANAEDLVTVQQDPAINLLNQQLNNLRSTKDALQAKFGVNHPEVRRLEGQIAAYEAEREREIGRLLRERQLAKLEQASKQVASYRGQLTELSESLVASSARMTDLTDKLSQYEALMEELDRLQARKTQVQAALQSQRVRSENPSAAPVRLAAGSTRPELVFPRPLVVVPGVTLLVLAAGTGLIFLRELMDQRLKSPADVKLLPDAELVGVVPHAAEDPAGPAEIEGVVTRDPGGLMAESFRNVRNDVLVKMDRRGYRTLMLTGPQPGSGTSAMTHNLALSLASNGRRVLIVDANARRPVQHRLAQVNGRVGLGDVVQGRAELSEAVQAAADTENLWVLPVGDAHDMRPEVLDHTEFHTLLGQLEAEYDLVLIDAPPALLTSEAQLLAKHTDASLLVARGGRDTRGMVERMINRLDGQRADVLGLVLNGVRSSAGGYFRKNYREFYRYRANGAASNGSGAPARPRTPAGKV